jgi:hypothetical protein
MMRRSLSVLFVVLLLMVALPALAQPPAGGGDRPGGDRPRDGMRGMMGPMQSPPVMMIAEGRVYVIYMGQLSVFDAATLQLVKTVALPMPQMMGPMGPGPGGPPPGGLPPGAGAPPPAPQ